MSDPFLACAPAAYVTSCDQYPRTIAAGSNFGEVFYGSVPVTSGSNVNSVNFPDGWFYFMARTVVHEVKHIVSIGARVQNNAPTGEQSWLEEGTARHAEEMWVRESLHHVNWKANTGFGTAATNGIYCDLHPLDATCNAADVLRRPSYGMRRQFNEIRDNLISPWDWSPYGDANGQTGSVFYQTTWSLVRYTIDRYATSEPAFFKALINSLNTGATNLSTVAGVPMEPVQLPFGTFTSLRGGLRGGAHAFYEIAGPAQSVQLISLRGVSGAVPSSNLRIAITRLQ